MATVYSLICWGGQTGKTASLTIASPCVVTVSNHGLRNGTELQFKDNSSDVLPTGLSKDTSYYARSTATNTFTLHPTSADAIAGTNAINTSGTQSGTHLLKSGYFLNSVPDYTRYGGAATTDPTGARVFDGVAAFRSDRYSNAQPYDEEICECGMSYEDYISSTLTLNIPCASVDITSFINGVRSDAFHDGVYDSGYVIKAGASFSQGILASGFHVTLDGITVKTSASSCQLFVATGVYNTIKNCFVIGSGAGSSQYGIRLQKAANNAINNVVVRFNLGIYMQGYECFGNIVANNTVVAGGTGFTAGTSSEGFVYNNVSVGNTTNWGTKSASLTAGAYNAGISTDAPWYTGTDTSVKTATADNTTFTSYSGNDYSLPTGSPLIDAGTQVVGIAASDMVAFERPAYNNGGAEVWDIGAFEKDLGYTRPTSDYYGLTFTGLLSGMFVKVFATGTDTERFSTTNSGTSETWSVNSSGTDTVDYVVMKAGYEPIRVTGITVTGGPDGIQSVPITPVIARWYQASSGLTIGTNAFANASTKKFGLTAASTLQNFASYLLEQWIALGDSGEAYANQPFPIAANGPNSFSWLYGWEADLTTYSATITNLSRDGMRYLDTGGTATASWCAIRSVNAETGTQLRYQQTDGGTTVDAENTGNMDQLVQIYGDASHGNFDYTEWLVIKAQSQGCDQTEVDVVNLYGTLEDQLYVVGMTQLANGVAAGNPTISDITITDHGENPVTWNAKSFSITITDAGTTTGENILKAIRYAQETGGTFQGKDAFNWHDLIQVNGSSYKGVRGAIYGDTGATLKGVRILRGTDAHPDFTLHTADDGTTVSTTPPAQATATVLADSRIQLYNVTTATELDNDFLTGTSYANTLTSGVSVGDTLRLRVDKLGYEEAVVTALWTTTGASFLVTQTADAVYTNNGIDGSAVTNITADVSTATVQINEAGGSKTWPMIYAYINYWRTTATGVAAENFMSATDTANYFLDAWKVRNTNANPLQLTGGWGRELTAGTVAACIDAAGSTGNIYAEPDHVVAYQTTGTYAITGDISTVLAAIPSAKSNADATLAAATAAGGIDANMTHTLGYKYTGRGIPPTYANQPTPIDPGDPFRVEGT